MTDEYKASYLISLGYVEAAPGMWVHSWTEHGVPRLMTLDQAFEHENRYEDQ